MAKARTGQMELALPATWGGRRAGAGRKRQLERPGPRHGRREAHVARYPVHVTMRAVAGVRSLRSERIFPPLSRALGASHKSAFRVVHFSVQQDHVHLVVEADSPAAFVNGVWGLAVRTARAVNRCARRRGQVWAHRYHHRALRTPREVRAGLLYVLLNFRKHLRAPAGIDPRSSGIWFAGWGTRPRIADRPCQVAAPRTWLASIGWRLGGGLLDPRDGPAPVPLRRARP
jgi:REP element-mobilizing transposase RayT